jgi:hypothetical protein
MGTERILKFRFGDITVPTHGFLSLTKKGPPSGLFNEHTRYAQHAVQTNVVLALSQTYLSILLNLKTLLRITEERKVDFFLFWARKSRKSLFYFDIFIKLLTGSEL